MLNSVAEVNAAVFVIANSVEHDQSAGVCVCVAVAG